MRRGAGEGIANSWGELAKGREGVGLQKGKRWSGKLEKGKIWGGGLEKGERGRGRGIVERGEGAGQEKKGRKRWWGYLEKGNRAWGGLEKGKRGRGGRKGNRWRG
jgi:hypothetical protein